MTGDEDLRDDLAYVRTLAEEGRNAPLVNGIAYVIWGGLVAAAALLVYMNYVGVIDTPFSSGFAPWIAVLIVGWILSMILGRRAGAKPGAATLGNKIASSVWFAVGIVITGFWVVLMIIHDNFVDNGVEAYFLFNLMFPMAFALYGVAFYATATAASAGWLRYVAFASWGFAVLCLFLMTSAHQLLAAAVGVIVCSVAPGAVLMRREPSDIV